ncbi:unnamed protein product [Fusarium fujikuroi]|nr:unnamed protein product [Fusarium fujikuroi]
MSRIEDSKESLRNSTIPNATGSSEVYGVNLTPSKWAAYGKRKAEGWYARNGTYTLAQLDSEIARLESLLRSYELASSLVDKDKDGKPQYPVAGALRPSQSLEDSKAKVEAAMTSLYEKQAASAGVIYNLQQGKPGDQEKAQKEVLDAQKKLQAAQDQSKTNQQAWNEYTQIALTETTKKDALNWFDKKETTIKQELDRLKSLRVTKVEDDTNKATSVPVIVSTTAPADKNEEPTGTTLAARGSEMANPVFKSPSDQPLTAQDADPWTNIIFSYFASDLFGELFSDVDIEVAKGVKLSPGPILFQKMIKEQNAADIAIWSQFPAYPTSFTVAADTTNKFTGATKHIEEHFDSYSNSGGASVGYGPWPVSSTFHKSASV